jgi:hypothetical protein
MIVKRRLSLGVAMLVPVRSTEFMLPFFKMNIEVLMRAQLLLCVSLNIYSSKNCSCLFYQRETMEELPTALKYDLRDGKMYFASSPHHIS